MAAVAVFRGRPLLRPAALCARAYGTTTATQPHRVQAKDGQQRRGEIVVVTSGKGGVGKTTTAASFAYGLAQRGMRTVAIDFDIGLRNLDLHLGMERRVIFDFVHVIREEATLQQALIRDRRCHDLYVLAASQTRDKTALTDDGVKRVLDELRQSFDYIICDSPAGIESGAFHAMYHADRAIMCTNPEVSSVRDSDKMLGLLNSKSFRAVNGLEPIESLLLITRYQPELVDKDAMLSVDDINEMLGIPCIGVIPESKDVLASANVGQPVILAENSEAAQAYQDFVRRFLGEEVPFRFLNPQPKSLLSRIFGR